MAGVLNEKKRSPQSTSSTPIHSPPSPAASGTSSGYIGQDQVDIAAAGEHPAPLVSTEDSEEIRILAHHSQALAISDPSLDCVEQEGLTRAYENREIGISTVQHSGQVPVVSSSGRAGHERGEIPMMSEQVQHAPSGATEKSEEIIITSIRATNVALGLRRLPAGFYVVLHLNGLEWRTENKTSSVNNDVIEWSGPIPISSDLSAVIRIEVYASFEYQPILGAGEHLRRLRATVGQLLDRAAEGIPFTFIPKDGDVVSPCSSVLVTVKWRKRENCDPSEWKVIGAHWSIPEPQGKLEDVTDQGHSALTRYRRHGDKRDLERSIQQFECALGACPWDDPRRAAARSNLATAKSILSQMEGTDASSDVALWLCRDALAARPVGHSDRPLTLIQLASMRLARLQRRKDTVDEVDGENIEGLLREAIELSITESYEKQAAAFILQLCAGYRGGRVQSDGPSSIGQDSIQSSADENPWELSDWLLKRFERFGDLADLQRTIMILERLVGLTSIWDDKYCVALGNLGIARCYRFKILGQLGDLEDAILTLREAVRLIPSGHPNKSLGLTSLGNSFQMRFECLGRLGDLEDAILTQREAVHLTPDGHPNKPALLSNLGNSLQRRFERLGQLNDLEDAISTQRKTVRLTPEDHPNRPMRLNNLGTFFQTRFERLGQFSDLEDAIATQREAVSLTPNGHPNKPPLLSNLGTSFRTRFERLGQLSDIEDAISAHGEAVRLSSNGHPDVPGYLNNLGLSFQRRFERLGQLSDLEDAISTQREAVRLTSNGHPNKPICLNNLGNSFETRFSHLGQLDDLEQAISTQKEAVRLTPDGHPDKSGYLNNLGNSFETRFSCLGQLDDLEDALSTLMEAVRLTPDGHPNKPTRLNNLGSSLQRRFSHLGQLDDLEDAISREIDAARLTPRDHPQRPSFLINLARSFTARFLRLRQVTDLQRAFSLSSYVASIPVGPASVRFSAAQFWIQCAQLIRHSESVLHAYSVAVNLTPQLAWVGLSFSHRYDQLIQSADVVPEAAAAALEAGFPETALEWLEQGRSVIWGDLFQLRSSHNELSSAHPDYASRLQALSVQLDQASAAHERSLSTLSEQSQSGVDHTPESLRRVANRHRGLAIERDRLLQEIRRLPGFGRFLLRKSFSQLRTAAHSGPVVILNAAKSRCDALVVVAGLNHVIHVPLPNFTSERCANIQVILNRFVRDARVGRKATGKGVSWDDILPPLWQCIVKPVLEALAFSVAPKELSRIFWCPTGPLAFLPIHAAGFYDRQHSMRGHKVFDFVVSSYVPTLALLARSPNPAAVPSGILRLLAVRQPLSDGQAPLPGVATELARIKDVIKNSPSAQTVLVESSVGTVEEVLELMKASDWVHFACHGVQDGVDSGLCLADRRRLTLRDIVAVSRPRGGLAFLSACQTAKGDRKLSDEAIHIAAGMLFAGYGGVIGTMWSISDGLAPRVARDVYLELLENGRRPDYREAARALQETIGRLRRQEVPISEWIPFIHVGL